MIKTTIESASAKANTALTDSLFVPKIIGIGPIMITPAPCTLLSPVPLLVAERISTETIKTTPMSTNAIPTAYSVTVSVNPQPQIN